MRSKIILSAASALVIFLCFFVMPAEVSAAEEARGRITLNCGVKGIVWDIYRVADAEEDGTIRPVDYFSEYRIPVAYDYREEVQTLARTFESYIKSTGMKSEGTVTTDENGIAVFTDLKQGWYTAVPQILETRDTIWESTAVMICVSSYSIYQGFWGTDVQLNPKVRASSKTGDSNKTIIIQFKPDPSYPEEEPIVIIIYKDDEEYDRVVLTKDNDWTLIFPDMPDDDTNWTIIQEDAPDDVYPLYHKETDRTDNTPVDILTVVHKRHYDNSISSPFVSVTVTTVPSDNVPEVTEVSQVTSDAVTETSVPETTPEITSVTEDSGLPQTGQLWWPVAVLASAGALLTAAGTALRMKGGDQ